MIAKQACHVLLPRDGFKNTELVLLLCIVIVTMIIVMSNVVVMF